MSESRFPVKNGVSIESSGLVRLFTICGAVAGTILLSAESSER